MSMSTLPLLALVWLASCAPRPEAADAAAYPLALQEALAAPSEAAEICAAVASLALRGDCVTAAAEQLAKTAPERAEGLCRALPDGLHRDECAFQVAEASDDPARCADAGRFADDCRMHLWTRALSRDLPRGARPGEVEAALRDRLGAYGFPEGDPRPWSALYRHLLSRAALLDRQRCAEAPDAALQEACRQTGLALYQDRLNYARDKKIYPCDGGPLPSILLTAPDPELDALRAAREDLCP